MGAKNKKREFPAKVATVRMEPEMYTRLQKVKNVNHSISKFCVEAIDAALLKFETETPVSHDGSFASDFLPICSNIRRAYKQQYLYDINMTDKQIYEFATNEYDRPIESVSHGDDQRFMHELNRHYRHINRQREVSDLG